MKKYFIIHVPIMSFFSKALYRDVGLYWKGLCFAYLLLLLAICWIPTMVMMHVGFSDFIDNEAPAVIEQVPEITITDGKLSIKEPQPYYIKYPGNDNVMAIIDTTETVESLEDPNAICLVTKTKIIWRQSKVETRTFDLSQVESFVLDSDRIMRWLRTAAKYLVVIIYPFALLGSYVYRIIQALIYAAIGLLFASWCKVSLSYDALLRLAITAVTPCIIVGTILGLVGVSLPAWLYLAAALGLLFFGVKACSETTQTMEETDVREQLRI